MIPADPSMKGTSMSTLEEGEPLFDNEEFRKHIAEGRTARSFAGITDEELEAIYAVAYNHFTAKKYDKAIDLFKFLCVYDHLEPRWSYSLGVTQQRKGDFAEAVKAFSVAAVLDALDPKPQVQAGYCLMALEQWSEAQSALEGGIIACGSDPAHRDTLHQAQTMLETVVKRLSQEKGAS